MCKNTLKILFLVSITQDEEIKNKLNSFVTQELKEIEESVNEEITEEVLEKDENGNEIKKEV